MDDETSTEENIMNAALQAAAEVATDAMEMSKWWRESSASWRQKMTGSSAEAILAALVELETRGWRLVNMNMVTDDMVTAAVLRPRSAEELICAGTYRAMVAAAPRITDETL